MPNSVCRVVDGPRCLQYLFCLLSDGSEPCCLALLITILVRSFGLSRTSFCLHCRTAHPSGTAFAVVLRCLPVTTGQ